MPKTLLCTLLLFLGVGATFRAGAACTGIACPPDLVFLTCTNEAVARYEVIVTGPPALVTCTPPSGTTLPLGTTNILCSATNNCGGITNCSFNITVKAMPSTWPCPEKQLGLGIPFELAGGATTVVRPASGPGSAGLSITPGAMGLDSGIVLKPGTARAIRFTTRIDADAPVGTGFELKLPFDPAHPLDPPVLSILKKGAKGYCVKMNKRFADDPASTMRASVVNSNGAVLPPVDFTPAEVEGDGVFDISFQPGVTNCHVDVELDCVSGAVTVEIPGPVVARGGRKGWDGCIYGPDRPVKKPTSRVTLTPPATGSIDEVSLNARGVPELVVEEPSLVSRGRKWSDGHVTLMKVVDDGLTTDFVATAPGGGVQVELGPSTSFEMGFTHANDPLAPPPAQTFRVGGGRWPLALTNRPAPPPPVSLHLSPGILGLDCAVDFNAWGFSNVTAVLWSGGVPAVVRTNIPGLSNSPACSLSTWPFVVGCPGVGVLRLGHTNSFTVHWPDGSSDVGDEIFFFPEIPPGGGVPETFTTVQCVASEGFQGRFISLQSTPAPPVDPLGLTCPGDIVTGATSAAGAVVNFSPILHVGECAAYPYPVVECSPPTGSLFPIGTTEVNCYAMNSCGEFVSCFFNVTVDQRPGIAVQPVSLVVTAGYPVQLTAEVYAAAPGYYQWQIFCPPTRPDFPFCGCLGSQTWRPLCIGCPPPFVEFPSATAQCDSGYYLIATNAFGAVTSAVAYITVIPVLVCPPDQTVLTCGTNAVFSYSASALGSAGPLVCLPPSGSAFPLGANTVTCTASNYSGTNVQCSFTVSVKTPPANIGCPPPQLGLGIPFELVGGATAAIRPPEEGSPSINLFPAPASTNSGIRFKPGPAKSIRFTTVLDFTAPPGAGFEVLLPPDPAHPNDPPILSVTRKSGPKGYCIKMNKRFANDPGATMRAWSVNTNGDLLDPITFTPAEVESIGVCDVNFQPGVTNGHLTVEINLVDFSTRIEFDGPVAPITPTLARHKGWDGCIYGPDRPRPKPPKTARVIMIPPVLPSSPPVTEATVRVMGWPVMQIEEPALSLVSTNPGSFTGHASVLPSYDKVNSSTGSTNRCYTGHISLLKARTSGNGCEFAVVGTNGGIRLDLGASDSFDLQLTKYETNLPPGEELLTRTIGPIRGLTNRPPPPFLDALLLRSTPAGVECSADFTNLDSPLVHVFIYSSNVLVAQRFGMPGLLDVPILQLPDWPLALGKLGGPTPCRRIIIKHGGIGLPGGAGGAGGGFEEIFFGDEIRILASLPPGAPLPDYYGGFEFIATDGANWGVSDLQRTTVCTPVPLHVESSSGQTVVTWTGDGFRLQGAVDAAGPWLDLGAESPVSLPPSHPARFFRLLCD
jgi:hypothetical protein